MKKFFLHTNLSLFLLLLGLWALHPELESDLIDHSDTLSYGSFLSHVGHRWMFVLIVKCFTAVGLSLHQTGILLNGILVLYFVYLLSKAADIYDLYDLNQTPMIWIICSPILLLQKNLLSTDLTSGLLFFHVFLIFEESKKTDQTSFFDASIILSAALWVVAQNIKLTAVIGACVYGSFLVFESFKNSKLKNKIFVFISWTLLFLVFEAIGSYFIFGDPFFKITETLHKPMGGNGINEMAGAKASVPVPLFLFHIFSHLKTVGRHGIPGLLSLFGVFIFIRKKISQLYLAYLIVFTILGFKSILVMERYWLFFIAFQMVLFYQTLSIIKEKNKIIYSLVILTSISLSLSNYIFRFYPHCYKSVCELFL